MILLPGEGIDDAEVSVSCPNCTEKVLVPSGSMRKVIRQLNKRKIQFGSDNLNFKYHYTAISEKRKKNEKELFYLRHALDETEDVKEYAELTRRYIKKQRMHLTTLQEAASVFRHIGVLVEETTAEYYTVINRALKRNWGLDGDVLDIRADCETLGRERRKFETYQEEMVKTLKAYRRQYSG